MISVCRTEELMKKALSCMRFCVFQLEYQIPDHTILCGFRNEIVAKKEYESLLKKINKVLGKHQEIVKTGVIVNVSITARSFSQKRTPTYVVEAGKEEGKKQISQRKERKKRTQSGVDT
ncbi:MAG: transposase [Flavobacteriales bacterium Tduv]